MTHRFTLLLLLPFLFGVGWLTGKKLADTSERMGFSLEQKAFHFAAGERSDDSGGQLYLSRPEIPMYQYAKKELRLVSVNGEKVVFDTLAENCVRIFNNGIANMLTVSGKCSQGKISELPGTNGKNYTLPEITLSVEKIPPPRLALFYENGQPAKLDSIPKKANMRATILPDSIFAENYPGKVKFKARDFELRWGYHYLNRNLTLVDGIGDVPDEGVGFNLGALMKADAPGTKVYLMVDDVYLVGEDGLSHKVDMESNEKALSLIIR